VLYLAIDFSWQTRTEKLCCSFFLLALGMAWILHFYPTALITIATVFFIPLARGYSEIWRKNQSLKRPLVLYFVFVVITAALCTWPYWIYNSRPLHFFTGGGRLELSAEVLWGNFMGNYSDLFVRSDSYLIRDIRFPSFPWMQTGVPAVIFSALGVIVARRNLSVRFLLMLAAGSLFITTLSASLPGIRRALEFIVVIHVLWAFALDWLIKTEKFLLRWACTIAVFSWILMFVLSEREDQLVLRVGGGIISLAIARIVLLCFRNPASSANPVKTALIVLMCLPIGVFGQAYQYVSKHYTGPSRPAVYKLEEPFPSFVEKTTRSMSYETFYWVHDKVSWDYVIMMYTLCQERFGDCRKPVDRKSHRQIKCIGRF
jgi:hypothetical protein